MRWLDRRLKRKQLESLKKLHTADVQLQFRRNTVRKLEELNHRVSRLEGVLLDSPAPERTPSDASSEVSRGPGPRRESPAPAAETGPSIELSDETDVAAVESFVEALDRK